jgi:hypothetical protein
VSRLVEMIDRDPVTGLETWIECDESAKKFHIHHRQDVSQALEDNKRLQIVDDYKKQGIKRSWMHYAHIPDVVVIAWMKEGIDVFNPDHLPAVKRKLRDPEYRHLRTTLGAI